MKYPLLTLLVFSSCSLLQPKVEAPKTVEVKVEDSSKNDAAKDIVTEISAVVKSYNAEEEVTYFKPKGRVKKERGILKYETKYSYRNKTINVLLEIITFNSKVSYTLNITASVNLEYSLNKRFEIKTLDADEVVTQAANILNAI